MENNANELRKISVAVGNLNHKILLNGVKNFNLGRPLRKNNLQKRKRFCIRGSILAPLCTKTGAQNLSEKCSDVPHIPSSTRTFRGFC
jgi:hypothetical protein